MMRQLAVPFFFLLSLLHHGIVAGQSIGTPHDSVVELTSENFKTMLEDPANGLFLLKFYAPWCGHCKVLKPILAEVAPKVVGKLAIGSIDCTVHKALCKEYEVKSFPTLKFYRDGKFYNYPGGRTAAKIMDFAYKMSQPPITRVANYEELLSSLREDEEFPVGFVWYDSTTNQDDPELEDRKQFSGQVFTQVSRKQQHAAKFYVLLDASTIPKDWTATKNNDDPFAIAKVEAAENIKPVFFTTRRIVPDTVDLIEFVNHENFRLITPFGPGNFHRVGHLGKPLVMGCISDPEESSALTSSFTDYIQNTGSSVITSQYIFGYIDGKKWNKFLEQFNITDLPQLLVLDVPTKRYYQNETYGLDVKSFLEAIDNGELKSQNADVSSGSGIRAKLHRIIDFIISNLPWSLIPIVGLLVILIMALLQPSEDDLRPPYTKNNNNSNTIDTDKPLEEEPEQDESKKDQ